MTTTLDHVGILVPGLDAAAPLLARLGFTLTRRAEHRNADGGSAGSAQCSMMFDTGYVEVQEIVGLAASDHLLAAAARRNFGPHIMAFGVPDASAAREAVARHRPVGEVLHWGRRIEEADMAAEARFAFFVAPYASRDEALLCWVRHLTPEALRTPRLVRHANGARALRSAIIATRDDPAPLVARYVACGGTEATPGIVQFAEGAVEIMGAAALPPALAATPWPASSWFAAIRIAFDDPATFAAAARMAGFGVAPWARGFAVDLLAPLGCVVMAEAAGA